ncbi:hypothetical protein EVAR_70797_1 [Eumeta japonica]|uniref:Uncharacterized protein n=1 Tax=Eumeta variegata TaxID=151549 RepID=A0A4C1SJ44_EUMVA|nr:hypothetical protein EVAR_70797_1 [Eumeta japonica]
MHFFIAGRRANEHENHRKARGVTNSLPKVWQCIEFWVEISNLRQASSFSAHFLNLRSVNQGAPCLGKHVKLLVDDVVFALMTTSLAAHSPHWTGVEGSKPLNLK